MAAINDYSNLYATSPYDYDPSMIKPSAPPFGYYGAKQRISSKIIRSLPPHNAWVEVFCGSAALTLAKKPSPIEVINDLNGEIVNLFKQLRENSDALRKAVALTPYARAEFLEARDLRQIENPLERARVFLVKAMMAVNGTVGAHRCGFSYSQSYTRDGKEARVSRWYNLPEKLKVVTERLRHVRVENRDAREIVEMFSDRPATLAYLDPPYFAERGHRYAIETGDESFHKELLDLCCRARCMILISGYDNSLYHDVLTPKRGWERSTIETTTRDTRGKDYKRTEVLWKNALFQKASRLGRVPIRLSVEEKEQRKVNPPRMR
jgi:DNA adenine methylase